MFGNTGPSDRPILIPFKFSYILQLKEKAFIWQVTKMNFLSDHFESDVGICFLL